MVYAIKNAGNTALLEVDIDLATRFPEWSFPPEPLSLESMPPDVLAAGLVIAERDPYPEGRFASVVPGTPYRKGAGWAIPWVTTEMPATDRRAEVSRQLDLYAKGLRDVVVADISAAEMASWPIKLTEAQLFLASGDDADAPRVAMEAQVRGTTTADLAQKVLVKAEQLSQLEAFISGETGRRQDLLKVADSAGIEAIAAGIATGWPIPGMAG